MEKVLNLYKRTGETPLERLDRLRIEDSTYKNVALSYVGRLDPLAEGVMLVVVGEENKNRLNYLGLNKEYIVDILFGFETDTGDPLGLVTASSSTPDTLKVILEKVLQKHVGLFLKEYPVYSSRTVEGKPLFEWAKEGRLSDIEIPKRKVSITAIELQSITPVSKPDLGRNICDAINSVHGDFRQKESLASWRKALGENQYEKFQIAKIHVTCGSGVYMRQLASEIGHDCGTHALAYHIFRTKVGEHIVAVSLM